MKYIGTIEEYMNNLQGKKIMIKIKFRKKRYFVFVDYENVQGNFFEFIKELPKPLNINIFYSHNNGKMSLELVKMILKDKKNKYYFYKIDSGGKNALDFQLSTYLGSVIKRYPNDNFVIISKDSGFDYAIKFWNERSINIERIPIKIEVKNNKKVDKIEIVAGDINQKVKLSGEELHKKYREFVKQYSQDKGLLLYRKFKRKVK